MKFSLACVLVAGMMTGGLVAQDLPRARPSWSYSQYADLLVAAPPDQGQELNAPSMLDVEREDRAENPATPVSTCGPKWLGGCYDPKTQMSWGEVFRDPKWKYPTMIFVAATAFDYAMTVSRAERPGPFADGSCTEKNWQLSRNPDAGDVTRDFFTTHVPVIVMGTFIHKVTGHSKWASWIYPGMMAYGTQLHVRGGVSWLGCPVQSYSIVR